MKKFLLILCALVCNMLAFAQTTVTYTDNLHVMLGSDDYGTQEATVDVEYTSDNVINFTLHGLAVSSYNVGDVTVKDVTLNEAVDGVSSFTYNGTNVEVSGGDFGALISLVTISVDMSGEISEEKLRANMSIDVKMFGSTLLSITADFGFSYEDYLIVNAETGNYLGGGLDWGTHATEIGKPQFFTFEEQADGTYKLNSHQGGTSLGWSEDYSGLYVDAVNPLTWEIIETDGGVYIATDEGYLTGNGFQEEVTLANSAGATAVWKLVTKDDVLATMADATLDNPVDVTPLIPAPEPKHNDWGSSWVATGYNTSAEPANYSLGQDWNTASCAESYHSNNGFDIRQTIPDLPAGYYTLSAQAFYSGDGTVVPVMYVGDLTEEIPVLTTTANNMESAYQEFLKELHPMSISFLVDEENPDVLVGFTSLTTGDNGMWTIFGELGLLYMGTESPTLAAVDGTMNVDVEAEMNAAIAAYNAEPTSATYSAALTAIKAAEQSVAHYAEIAEALASGEYENVLATFDEAGQAAFEDGFITAYEARTLTDETIEDGLSDACKQQTTAGSDMTYAMKNSGEWVNAIGATNFQMCPSLSTAHEIWSYSSWALDNGETSKAAIYKQIEDLPEGEYTVSFYAFGNEAANASRPLAYANDAETEVAYAAALAWNESSLYTLECEVGEDGILQFGMKTQGDGNWYVMEEYSLTFFGYSNEPDEDNKAYEFVAEDWVASDNGRVTADNITYNEDNTITVVADGQNNIALGNNTSASWYPAPEPDVITTANYTITKDQMYFVVVGSDLSIGTTVDEDGKCDSYMWWMNGWNEGSQVPPTEAYVLEDGQVMYVWDISSCVTADDDSGLITLDGGTCFGLTSTADDHSATISDINFYTANDIANMVAENKGVPTGIKNVETEPAVEGIYDLSGRKVSKAVKGVYIIDGKKVIVK